MTPARSRETKRTSIRTPWRRPSFSAAVVCVEEISLMPVSSPTIAAHGRIFSGDDPVKAGLLVLGTGRSRAT